jgi:AraC family transcriptional regulator
VGLEEATVPAQTYLVFRQAVVPGPFHPQVAAAMGEIWVRRVPQSGHRPSGGPDFELFPPDLVPGATAGWVAYYAPVEA